MISGNKMSTSEVNFYETEIDELSDDSEEYDFEKELGNKDEDNLDSFDEDFGRSSDEEGEEEEDSIEEGEWDKRAEEAKRFVIKKGGKSKLHKKKGV